MKIFLNLFIALILTSCSTEKEERIIIHEGPTLPTPDPSRKIYADLVFFSGSSWRLLNIFEDYVIVENPTYVLNRKTYQIAMIFERGTLKKVFIQPPAEALKTIYQAILDKDHTAYVYYAK
jgi:ABC-type taurine transport system substrate-binding protein